MLMGTTKSPYIHWLFPSGVWLVWHSTCLFKTVEGGGDIADTKVVGNLTLVRRLRLVNGSKHLDTVVPRGEGRRAHDSL